MALWPHTGAIFCGGESRRMGGIPKAGLILSEGVTLIEHVYRALKVVCRDIILIGHARGVPDTLRFLKRIKDNIKGVGPIGGLEALLSSGLDTEYLITPCDLNKVTSEVFILLTAANIQPPAVLKNNNKIEPLIARYSADQLSLVRAQIIEKKLAMKKLATASRAIVVPFEHKDPSILSNINTPEEDML